MRLIDPQAVFSLDEETLRNGSGEVKALELIGRDLSLEHRPIDGGPGFSRRSPGNDHPVSDHSEPRQRTETSSTRWVERRTIRS